MLMRMRIRVKHYVEKILKVEGKQYQIVFVRTVSVNKFIILVKKDVVWIKKRRINSRIQPIYLRTISCQRTLIFSIFLSEILENT